MVVESGRFQALNLEKAGCCGSTMQATPTGKTWRFRHEQEDDVQLLAFLASWLSIPFSYLLYIYVYTKEKNTYPMGTDGLT